jgi:hypothetical protein
VAVGRTSVTAVVSKVPQVVERPRRFPAAVEIELERRRRLLLGQVTGRVLDLDLAEHRAEVARASVERHVVPAYDTALVVGQLVRFPDLGAALRGIDRLLSPEGRVLLVEPTGRPGLAAVLSASAWSATPRLRGFHVARDVTAAMRTTSFCLDDIERFSMPTVVSSLRHGVEIHAVRLSVPAEAPAVPVEAGS